MKSIMLSKGTIEFSDFLASLYSNCYDFGFFDNDNRISLYMLGPIEEIDTLQVY